MRGLFPRVRLGFGIRGNGHLYVEPLGHHIRWLLRQRLSFDPSTGFEVTPVQRRMVPGRYSANFELRVSEKKIADARHHREFPTIDPALVETPFLQPKFKLTGCKIGNGFFELFKHFSPAQREVQTDSAQAVFCKFQLGAGSGVSSSVPSIRIEHALGISEPSAEPPTNWRSSGPRFGEPFSAPNETAQKTNRLKVAASHKAALSEGRLATRRPRLARPRRPPIGSQRLV